MRRVLLSQIQPGMTLARPIYNARGDQLLTRGVEITPRLIRLLEERGYMSALISDSLSEDIHIPEIISERVRSVTSSRLFQTYQRLTHASEPVRGTGAASVESAMASREFRKKAGGPDTFQRLWNDVQRVVDEVIAEANTSMAGLAEGLACMQSHDDTNFGHSIDMAAVAVFLGRLIHLEQADLRRLAMGAMLSDVGTIFLDPKLLSKPSAYTEEERKLMEMHPVWGFELMKTENWGDLLTRHIVYQHHEQQDGEGYPRGLQGTNRVHRTLHQQYDGRYILLTAEIVAVADAYETLTSERPHRAAMPHNRSIALLREMAGTQLNAELVQYFLSVTPAFPPGMEVTLREGDYDGFRALVVRTPAETPDRPVVRVFRDAAGKPLDPFDIALADEPQLSVSE